MTELVITSAFLILQSRLDPTALALLQADGSMLEADALCFMLDPDEHASLRILDPSSTAPLRATPSGWTRPEGAAYIEVVVVAPLVESIAFELSAGGSTAGKVRTMHIKTKPKGTLPDA